MQGFVQALRQRFAAIFQLRANVRVLRVTQQTVAHHVVAALQLAWRKDAGRAVTGDVGGKVGIANRDAGTCWQGRGSCLGTGSEGPDVMVCRGRWRRSLASGLVAAGGQQQDAPSAGRRGKAP